MYLKICIIWSHFRVTRSPDSKGAFLSRNIFKLPHKGSQINLYSEKKWRWYLESDKPNLLVWWWLNERWENLKNVLSQFVDKNTKMLLSAVKCSTLDGQAGQYKFVQQLCVKQKTK